MPSLITPVLVVSVMSPEHGPRFVLAAGANVAGRMTGVDCAVDGIDEDTIAEGSGGVLKLCAGALVAPAPCPLAYVA